MSHGWNDRRYQPYQRNTEHANNKPKWSFEEAFRDMNELLQDLTVNTFKNLNLKPADVARRRNGLGRRCYNDIGRFHCYVFKRSELPWTSSQDSVYSTCDEFELTPDLVQSSKRHGKQADLLEKLLMGTNSTGKEYTTKLMVCDKEQSAEDPEPCNEREKSDFGKRLLNAPVKPNTTYVVLELVIEEHASFNNKTSDAALEHNIKDDASQNLSVSDNINRAVTSDTAVEQDFKGNTKQELCLSDKRTAELKEINDDTPQEIYITWHCGAKLNEQNIP